MKKVSYLHLLVVVRHRGRQQLNFTRPRMVYLGDDTTSDSLRMRECLFNVVDGCEGKSSPSHLFQPFSSGMRMKSFGENRDEGLAICDAGHVGRIEWVDGQIGAREDLAEFDKLGVWMEEPYQRGLPQGERSATNHFLRQS